MHGQKAHREKASKMNLWEHMLYFLSFSKSCIGLLTDISPDIQHEGSPNLPIFNFSRSNSVHELSYQY